jgi:beta-glucosidase-like glycosyl hydrolase
MAKAIAREAAAIGVNQLFAPLGDLARELRYGRVRQFKLLTFVTFTYDIYNSLR